MSDSTPSIPNRIKELRSAAGLSADKLARLIGTTRQNVNGFENGGRNLSTKWMAKIAIALKCKPADLLATGAGSIHYPTSPTRRERGEQAISRVHGEVGLGYVATLRETFPDFADMLVDFPYGDIYARDGLDPKSRQIATIAALTILGDSRHELEIHIASALRIGLTRQEIIEVIMQMAVYGGFPRALSALAAAKAAFANADIP